MQCGCNSQFATMKNKLWPKRNKLKTDGGRAGGKPTPLKSTKKRSTPPPSLSLPLHSRIFARSHTDKPLVHWLELLQGAVDLQRLCNCRCSFWSNAIATEAVQTTPKTAAAKNRELVVRSTSQCERGRENTTMKKAWWSCISRCGKKQRKQTNEQTINKQSTNNQQASKPCCCQHPLSPSRLHTYVRTLTHTQTHMHRQTT